jgi:hypothetical protein
MSPSSTSLKDPEPELFGATPSSSSRGRPWSLSSSTSLRCCISRLLLRRDSQGNRGEQPPPFPLFSYSFASRTTVPLATVDPLMSELAVYHELHLELVSVSCSLVVALLLVSRPSLRISFQRRGRTPATPSRQPQSHVQIPGREASSFVFLPVRS